MPIYRKSAATLVLILGVFLIGAGVSTGVSPQGKQLVVVHGVDPETLDPANDTVVPSLSTMMNIFDPLIQRSREGTSVPALATSWSYADPTTLALRLRKGVKWHDGSLFTADDVVFTFQRLLRETKPLRVGAFGVRANVASAEKIDDYTVRIKTKGAWAPLLNQLAIVMIVPKKAMTEMGEDRFGVNPVGTGPYKFVRWNRNEQIVLEANVNYWRGRPRIGRLIVKPIPEEFARFAALATGAADIVSNLAPERIPLVKRNLALRTATVRGTSTVFIGMNTRIKPFSDKRVRQAMNYAVNTPELIRTVLGGYGLQNPSPCAGADFGHDPTLRPYPYNPAKAIELLKEAGYPQGFKVTLAGPNGRYPKDKEVQLALAGQLAEVGIQVEHFMPEWADYFGRWLKGEYQMYLLGGGSTVVMDCDLTLGGHFDSKRRGIYYSSPRTDELIWAQASAVDPKIRLGILAELQRVIAEDAPWIFLFDPVSVYGVRQRVQWEPRSDEIIWAYDADVKN